MPRRTAFLRALGLLAAVLLLGAFDRTWKPFTNKAANFEIMMPGAPTIATATEASAAGPVALYQASVIGADRAYFVSYSDLPRATWRGDPDKMLAGARDGAAARVGGKVIADRPLTLARTWRGREFTIVVGDKLELTQRVYLVKHRLYQANIGCAVGACAATEVQAFLDSFKLLRAPR